jgi:hypothetical protein
VKHDIAASTDHREIKFCYNPRGKSAPNNR